MKKFIVSFARFYQKTLSPNHGLGFFGFYTGCRFYPSCSEYLIKSLEKHGFLKGILKSFFRVLRCGPWSCGGIDYP